MEPFEIIGAPFTVWVAPLDTPFPDIDDAESAFDSDWFKLGTSGDKNYDEDGVTVSHPQSVEPFRGAGSTVPRKIFRTEEDVLVAFNLADMSPEQYAKVMDDRPITTTAAGAGVAGNKAIPLYRGPEVAVFSLLARGPSSVVEGMYSQFEIPSASQVGEPEPQFTKGKAAVLALEYQTVDASGEGDIGTLRIGTAPAS